MTTKLDAFTQAGCDYCPIPEPDEKAGDEND